MAGAVQRHGRVWVHDTMIPCLLPGHGSLTNDNEDRDFESQAVIGDVVDLAASGTQEYLVQRIRQRQTLLLRGHRRRPDQKTPIAANGQILLIVRDIRTPRDTGFVEQSIAAARRGGLEAILCIHKTDAASARTLQAEQEYWQFLELLGISVFFTSKDHPEAWLPALQQRLAEQRVVVVGTPGAGKTTLIRALTAGELRRDPTPTTAPDLQPAGSGWFVDTPGFKDFALAPLTQSELELLFPDVVELAARCQFTGCSHSHEPGCAVKGAVQQGRLERTRVQLQRRLQGAEATAPSTAQQPQGQRDYTQHACGESFTCGHCGSLVVPDAAGTRHRNHCPTCLGSVHVDNRPGDRAALCGGLMDPVSVWVRQDGEWAIIHRCRLCGELHSNRIAADDNSILLVSLAVKPLSSPPFPLSTLAQAAAAPGQPS